LISKLLSLSRLQKKIILILFDSLLLIIFLFLSFYIRLDHWYWITQELLWLLFSAPFIAIPIFIMFGLYRNVTRFIGFKAIWEIIQATSLYALIWGIIAFMSSFEGIPRSVVIINLLLSIIVIGSSRLLARWIISEFKSDSSNLLENVLIYGAGSSGRQLSIALSQSDEYNPIAFIDENLKIKDQSINGIKIYHLDDIERLITKKKITQVLLAMPEISRFRTRQIIDYLEPFPVSVRSLPSLTKLVQGKVKVEDLYEIDIKDLLGRDLVKPNVNLLKVNITDKVVLVTGAGGSIGSELCRQILFLQPNKLILFDVSESALYQIEQEILRISYNDLDIIPVIGSVRDSLRMQNIFTLYNVQTIYHAAAYKHVPLVESNQSQGVLNNTIGTMLAVEQAIAANVETFVLISTDKAVRPSSTMGATKRVAELILQALSKEGCSTCLTMVRFGNVLDSSGSVIPLFKKQIKRGGPVTVTDINMVRYFMTIPEAVELVIQAGAMGIGGDVFVLDMGEPVKINDLAVKLINLSGLSVKNDKNPDGEIEIHYTGLRPGEKLYEELLVGNNVHQTENDLIMRAEETMKTWEELLPLINQLENAALNSENSRIRELLLQIVPEFKPSFEDNQ